MEEQAPRVLIECEDAAVTWAARSVLERHGYEVSTCAGPQAFGSEGCPIVRTGHCDLVADADVVVHALDGGDPANRAVLRGIVDSASETPVVAEAPARRARAGAPLPDGVGRMRSPMTRARLLGAVIDTVGRPGADEVDDRTS